jgi:hypothetical protein
LRIGLTLSQQPVMGASEPTHGVALPGIGTGMGLIPPLSISVAPSGIVPPLSVKPELLPGLDSGEAVPLETATPDDVQLDVEVSPPPSKVELVPGALPVVPVLVPNIPE